MPKHVISIPPPERRITVDEAALRLRKSRRSIHRYMASGELTTYKAGFRTLLDSDEVDSLISRRGAA